MAPTLREYRVVWEIDVYGTSPQNAAKEALKIQRDPKSTATVFDVYRIDTDGETDVLKLMAKCEPVRVDLEEYRPRRKRQ
jgi:hypothetical protein